MRKLALFSIPFSASIILSFYVLPSGWRIPAAVIFAAAAAILTALQERWLKGFALMALGAAIGLGMFEIHALRTTVPAHLLDGETRSVTVRLLDYPQVYDQYSRVTVRLEGEDVPKLNAILYDNDRSLAEAEPGDRISLTALIRSADQKYGKRYDYHLSRDIYVTLHQKSEFLQLSRGLSLRDIPVYLHHVLTGWIDQVFPEDTAPFMKSLMLGDKSDLYEDEALYLALSRAGLMHALAVSGMHIAFLVGVIRLLFGSRKRSAILCIALVWLFVLVTGGSPSAVRAGIMQSLLLLAPILKRENDPLTSLSAALALILLQNPYAAGSVSLQLSFASMAGILCLAQPLHDLLLGELQNHRLSFLLDWPAATVASSLAAMAFTLPLMAIHFGYLSILSPLSNVLCLWMVSFCFIGGYFCCALALVFKPAGLAAAALVRFGVRYISLIAGWVSAIPNAVVYVRGIWIPLWMVLTYVLFFAAILFPLKRRQKLLLPLVISGLCLSLVLSGQRLAAREGSRITIHDVGQGQCVSVYSGDSTVVIDCGGFYTLKNAGETLGEGLLSAGRARVDLLLLTHLDADHVNGVPMLLEMCPVRALILPQSPSGENDLMEQILSSCKAHGTEVYYVGEEENLRCGEIAIRIFPAEGEKSSNDSGLIYQISMGEYDMLITGDASAAAEKALLSRHPLRDIELLIVGHHGSAGSSSRELLNSIGADTAVISVGYNSYGLPDQETLERIAACGYNIYRTDENGTMEIRIGSGYGKKTQ